MCAVFLYLLIANVKSSFCFCVWIYSTPDLTVKSTVHTVSLVEYLEIATQKNTHTQQQEAHVQSPPHSIHSKWRHSFTFTHLLCVCVHLFLSHRTRCDFLLSLQTGRCVQKHNFSHKFGIRHTPNGIPSWTTTEIRRVLACAATIVENFQRNKFITFIAWVFTGITWFKTIFHNYSGTFFCVYSFV